MVKAEPPQHTDRVTIEGSPEGPASSRKEAPPAALIFYERGGARLVEVPPDRTLTVGREWPADVLVEDRSISRQHARFEWRGGELHVDDLESKNGTLVAGRQVETARLRSGDIVQLGAVTVSVHVVDPATSPLRGIDTYDSLLLALDEELTRARHFGRNAALVALRVRKSTPEGHVSLWCPRVRRELREVDRMATYNAESALILLPEVDQEEARSVALALVKSRDDEPPLVAGVAAFPHAGISAQELVAAAQEATLRSTDTDAVTVHASTGAVRREDTSGIIVQSPRMHEVYRLVERIAKTAVPVLILGETGVGKEVVARALHAASGRASGPLQIINCAAIPASLTESVLFGHERGAFTGADRSARGVFEEAHKGTLLLDEVGELSPAAQATLLRVLESKRVVRVGSTREVAVDVRVLAATHRDLDGMVAAGTFRADLLFRVNAITLPIPPLRERREEIPELARRFVRAANGAWGTAVEDLDRDALSALTAYDWPGNVRELRNAMERAVAICGGRMLRAADLPERVRQGAGRKSRSSPDMPGEARFTAHPEDPDRAFKDRVRDFELELIVSALERTGGNQSRAAELLQMPLRTLVHKIRALGIKKSYARE